MGGNGQRMGKNEIKTLQKTVLMYAPAGLGGAAHEAAEGEVAGVVLAILVVIVAVRVLLCAAGVVDHGEGRRVGVAGRVELGAGVAALEGRAAQRPLLAPALARPAVELMTPSLRDEPRVVELRASRANGPTYDPRR